MTSFASDEPPEPSPQEIEYTLVTLDTIDDCRFEDILVNISTLPVASLRSLLKALLAQIPDSDSPILNVPTPPEPSASPRAPERPTRIGPIYKPELVFILELATALALRDEDTAKELYIEVGGALQTVLRDAHEHHSFMVSRCVYYLLKLLMKSKVCIHPDYSSGSYTNRRRMMSTSARTYCFTASPNSQMACSKSAHSHCLLASLRSPKSLIHSAGR